MKPYKYVCSKCGSDEISADAYAAWNVDEQEWEVQNVMDKGHYCAQCDGECRIERRVIE